MIPLLVEPREAREIRAGDVLASGDQEQLTLERVTTAFRQRDWRYRIVCERSRVLWHDGETYLADGETDRSWAYRPEHTFLVVIR